MSKAKKSTKVEEIRTLFSEVRKHEKPRNMEAASQLQQQIAGLAGQVASENPDSEEHAEALHYHECTLLALSRIASKKAEQAQLRHAAYALGAQSVDILLGSKKLRKTLGTVYASYNLAIDLIVVQKSYELGLKYMLASKRIFKSLPAKQRPYNYRLFYTNFGIAAAHFGLGRTDLAKKVLRKQLKNKNLKGANKFIFADLRGLSKCAELLAKIDLAERLEKRKAEEKAAVAKQKKAGAKPAAAGNDPTNSK